MSNNIDASQEEKKSISIVRATLDTLLQNPKGVVSKLLDHTIGRVNIINKDKIYYLMTQEKFEFFVKYELKRQKISFDEKLAECQEANKPKEEINTTHMTQAQLALLKIKNRFELFKNLTDEDVISIMDDIIISQYEKDEKVFSVGTTEKNMYYIVRGEVSVLVGPAGDIDVATLKKGQFFGEMAYVMNEKRTATIKAKSEIVILLSFVVREKMRPNTQEAYMKLFQNINKMLAHKIVMENKKKN